jgi:hypothetical protein
VAVQRGRQPLQPASSDAKRIGELHKDLLVLDPDGQLRLFVGCSLILRVLLPQLLPGAYEPLLGSKHAPAREPSFSDHLFL